MIKNSKRLEEFEKKFLRLPISIQEKFKLLDAMYEFSNELGVFDKLDPLEGIEVKIKLARAINNVQKAFTKDR